MFIFPVYTISETIYINPNYENRTTICRPKKNEVTFIIEDIAGDNTLTLTYIAIFESIHNGDILVNTVLDYSAKIVVTKFKDDDLIALHLFLKEVYLKIETYLQKNIPANMISLVPNLKLESEIDKLKESVFSELIRQGCYLI